MSDARSSFAGVFSVALALALAGGLVSLTVAGEPRCGIVRGRVVDAGGAPVAGAFVSVPTVDGEGVRRVRTDSGGYFRAARVPVGEHRIGAQRRGYRYREHAVGPVEEGREADAGSIVLWSAPDFLEMSVAYPLSVATGGRKRIYVSGFCSQESARVRFSIHPYDLVGERVRDLQAAGGEGFENRRRIIANPGKLPPAVWSWERSYSTSELDGSFNGYPATPKLDRPGTYLVVAALGDLSAGDTLNVTSLALVAKRDENGVLAWVTDIRSGRPVAGAAVEALSRNAAPVTTATDRRGLARLPGSGEDCLVVARHKGSAAFTDSSYYKEGYAEDCLIYTDRPLYRPGHTVHFKGIFRRSQPGSYQVLGERDVEFVVEDPEGREAGRVRQRTNGLGTAAASWRIPEDARLGSYRVRVDVDGRTADARFSVDEYRKPEYAVEISLPQPSCVRGTTVEATVRANYYFGAPVADAEVSYTVYRSRWWFRAYDSEFESWFDQLMVRSGYDYGGYGEVVLEGSGRTDASGQLKITLDTAKEEELARWVVEARVVDISMREVTASAGVTVTPADFSVQASPRRYVTSPGEAVAVDVRTVDWTGKPVPRRSLEAVVERVSRVRTTERFVETARIKASTGADGRGMFRWTPEGRGDYRIRLECPDDSGRIARDEARVWVVSPGQSAFYGQGPPEEDLTLVRDRKIYRPGDTAKLLVRSSPGDVDVLLTVEGQMLHEARVLRVSPGGMTVDIPLAAAHRPGVTVSCLAIRDGQMLSRTEELAVSPEESFLTVELSSSRERYRPGEQAEYSIRTLDAEGRGVQAEVSLGVVDEAIYALRADSTPDLRRHFWGPRYNRVSTSSSVEDYYLGGVDKFEDSVRRDFRDTAFWAPQILTDGQGRATVRFKLPDNLTTWRATARAVTAETAVGSAVHRCTVTKDVMVRLQAPRFFRERDRLTLGVIVHNYTPQRRRIRLSLKASGLEVRGASGRTVTVDAGGARRIPVEVAVLRPGQAVLLARADGGSPEASDAMEQRFPVHPHGVAASVARSGLVPVREAAFILPQDAAQESARLRLEVSSSAAGAVFSGLRYLVGYPWGCVEQVTSSFVPGIIARRAVDRLGLPMPDGGRDLPQMLRKGVRLLREAQNPDGSWGWFGGGPANLEMTAYVLLALREAQAAGVAVPEDMVKRGILWLADAVRGSLPPPLLAKDLPEERARYRRELEEHAFALAALAAGGAGDRTLFKELWRRQAHLSDFALACLGMTAAASGWPRELTDAATALQGRKKTESGLVFWAGSPDPFGWGAPAATAMAMRVLHRAGRTARELEPVAAWLATQRQGDHWENTRETSLVILALVEHMESLSSATGTAEVFVNGRKAGSFTFTRLDAFRPPRFVELSGRDLQVGRNTVTIRLSGRGTAFWSGLLSFVSSGDDMPAAPGYFNVTRAFQRVRLEKQPDGSFKERADPLKGRVRVGETVRMRIQVRPRSSARYVLVECPLPAGFEVVDREGAGPDAAQEVRDDRVGIFSHRMDAGGQSFDLILRAEVPGDLRVMPVSASAMYAAQLSGRSAGARLTVR